MAMTMAFVCQCGAAFSVYIPNARLFELCPVPGPDVPTPAELQAIDAAEEAAGEIEFARRTARATGAEFIDGRQGLAFTCPRCGRSHDPAEEIRQRLDVGHHIMAGTAKEVAPGLVVAMLVGEEGQAARDLADKLLDAFDHAFDRAEEETRDRPRGETIYRTAVSNALRMALALHHLMILEKHAACTACATEFLQTGEPMRRVLDALERALPVALAAERAALATRECRHGRPGPEEGREEF